MPCLCAANVYWWEWWDIYLLLTEFKVCTVSYRLSFSRWFMACVLRSLRGSVTYSTDQENSVSKIFIISLWLIRHAGRETSQSQVEGSKANNFAGTSSSNKTVFSVEGEATTFLKFCKKFSTNNIPTATFSYRWIDCDLTQMFNYVTSTLQLSLGLLVSLLIITHCNPEKGFSVS